MFNAIRYTKTLEAAGFSREQAEATIDVFLRFMEHNFSTKSDLQELLNEMKEFRAEVRHSLVNLEHRMIIKLGLMQAASIGIFAALVKFL
jgi:hypothetical protein